MSANAQDAILSDTQTESPYLREEHVMLRDQVRRFVREEIIPLEAKLDPDASELDPADHARLVEKTKGLEATQQESIDQLQVVQDQLQTMKRLMAAQQADTKRLSEQVASLNESIDGLRQSFASARATDVETPTVTRRKPARHRVQASARKRSRG